MALDDIEFLLRSYRFLDQAIVSHGPAMTAPDRDRIEDERAQAFRRLLTEPSNHLSVMLLQLKTLMACLANAPDDAELVALVLNDAQKILKRLSGLMPLPGDVGSVESSPLTP
jgi:hypothetical protein